MSRHHTTDPLETYPYNYEGDALREGRFVVIRTDLGHLCGYTAIDNRLLPASWHGSYDPSPLQLMAIHGGVTYAENLGDFTIFGFDCCHAGDRENPALQDVQHVMALVREMDRLIMLFITEHWPTFAFASVEERCAIIDQINAASAFPANPGLGGMLAILSGKV